MRRLFAVLVVIILLLLPVTSFADDPVIMPPIPSSHCVTQPNHSFGFWDLLLIALLEL